MDSAVAPLVAIAQGLHTVTPATLRQSALALNFGAMNTPHGKQLATNVGEHDAMVMPWYSPQEITQAERRRDAGSEDALGVPVPASIQIRPHPQSGRISKETGQRLKYDILSGGASTLGVHPATPVSWLREAKTMLVTEGALKGASGLTAQLLAAGVSADELAIRADDDQASAISRLHALMENVPVDKRVLIVTFVGVGNWHHNPDWNSFRLNSTRVLVAFDGDVATNPNVWHQAHQLWSYVSGKKGEPAMLALDGGDEKLGMDDYLAGVGDWESLLRLRVSDLPPRPTREEAPRPGDTRMNDTDRTMEKYVVGTDDFGTPTAGVWVPEVEYTARIAVTETQVSDLTDDPDTSSVELEFTWQPQASGDPGHASINGPSNLLADRPAEWHKRGIVDLPLWLVRHPQWPTNSAMFLGAMKGHRVDDVVERFVYKRTGWLTTVAGQFGYLHTHGLLTEDGDLPEYRTRLDTDVEMNLSKNSERALDPEELKRCIARVAGMYDQMIDATPMVMAQALSAWTHAGMKPTGGGWVKGLEGSGKSTAVQAVAAQIDPIYSPETKQVMLAGDGSTPSLQEGGIGQQNSILFLDDVREAHDPDTQRDQRSWLTTLVSVMYQGGTARRSKMVPDKNGGWRLGRKDRSNPAVFVTAEIYPPALLASSRDRMISCEVVRATSLRPDGKRELDDLGTSGDAQVVLIGFLRWVMATVSHREGGHAQFVRDYEARSWEERSSLTARGIPPRTAEVTSSFTLGWELWSDYLEWVGEIDMDDVRQRGREDIETAARRHATTILRSAQGLPHEVVLERLRGVLVSDPKWKLEAVEKSGDMPGKAGGGPGQRVVGKVVKTTLDGGEKVEAVALIPEATAEALRIPLEALREALESIAYRGKRQLLREAKISNRVVKCLVIPIRYWEPPEAESADPQQRAADQRIEDQVLAEADDH